MYDLSKCALCKSDLTESDPSVQVHQKELNTRIRIIAERNIEAVIYLQEVDSSALVHHEGRSRFDDTCKRSSEEATQPKTLRLSLDRCFDWNENKK